MAMTVTAPDTLAPLAGVVSVITGGVMSGITEVNDTCWASVPAIF
jgi:hypothetical protein